MANKKTLDDLILEVLNEEVYGTKWEDVVDLKKTKTDEKGGAPVVSSKETELPQDSKVSTAFKILAAVKDPKGTLDDGDLQILIDNPELVTTDIMYALYTIKYSANSETLKTKTELALKNHFDLVNKKSLEKQTFSSPQIQTATGESGNFPDEIGTILNTLFNPGIELKTKMRAISEISKMFYLASGALAAKRLEKTTDAGLQKGAQRKAREDAVTKFNRAEKDALETLENMDLRQFINNVMLMEYFVEISKSFDAGTGGYVFEWFLALLAGGRITGKESGPSGGMGAVDFVYTAGNRKKRGSAKYYQKPANIKQAASGFREGEKVDYFIAIKKQGMEQIKTTRGTSDPTRLVAAEIYTPSVKREIGFFDDNGEAYTPESKNKKIKFEITYRTETQKNLKTTYKLVNEKEQLKFDSTMLGKALGIIFIADVPTENFRDMLYRAVKNTITSKKENLLKHFESFFSTLDSIDSNARIYTSSGDIDKANNVISGLNLADDQFDELMSDFGQKSTISTIGKERPIEENKSLKRLDKLIERVILEHINK